MSGLVAVTGASGFLGGYVLEALAARGWRLRVLLRRWLTPPPAIAHLPVEAVTGDLSDEAGLVDLVRGTDAVVHLAGLIKSVDPKRFEAVNVGGTGRLARVWRREAPAARFIGMSSMAARSPAVSPYAASKSRAEAALRAEAGEEGDWRILRPAAVYGPRDRETLMVFRLANHVMQPLLNRCEARLCVVHARDVAGAVAATLDDPEPRTLRELSDARWDGYGWREIATEAACALGRKPRPVRLPAPILRGLGAVGDVVNRLAGIAAMPGTTKVRELLHADWASNPQHQPPPTLWIPRIGITEGFAETVAAHRAAHWL